MSALAELAIAIVMAIGLVGTVVPVVPGIMLVWFAGLVWTIGDGGGSARWVLFFFMTVLTGIAIASSIVLPARATNAARLPRWGNALGALLGIVGFFIIPVLGVPLGFASGVFLAHFATNRDLKASVTATSQSLKAFGVSMLVHAACASVIVALWLVGLVLT